jgi:hypothetical protein
MINNMLRRYFKILRLKISRKDFSFCITHYAINCSNNNNHLVTTDYYYYLAIVFYSRKKTTDSVKSMTAYA